MKRKKSINVLLMFLFQHRLASKRNFSILTYSLIFSFFIPLNLSQSDNLEEEMSLKKEQIQRLIKSPQVTDREKGANLVLNALDFDTVWAVQTILDGLLFEENYLKESKKLHARYVYTSWDIIQKYNRDLAFLGSNSAAAIGSIYKSSNRDKNKWAIIALGYQKEETVHDELSNIINENSSIFLTAMALDAISNYGDPSDIPVIQSVFYNTDDKRYTVEFLPDGSILGFDPVIQIGMQSMKKLGYSVWWDADGIPIFSKLDE